MLLLRRQIPPFVVVVTPRGETTSSKDTTSLTSANTSTHDDVPRPPEPTRALPYKQIVRTLDPPKHASVPRVLVVGYGQTRGGEQAWDSLRSNLLLPNRADLALLVPRGSKLQGLQRFARYVWYHDEYDDWGDALNEVEDADPAWHAVLCKRGHTFLGGVKHCHRGSAAGILLWYRWKLEKLLRTIEPYTVYVFTRLDYVYICQLKIENGDSILLPNDEGYQGVTDRFAVVPAKWLRTTLNVTRSLLSNPNATWVQETMKNKGRRGANLEQILLHYYTQHVKFKRREFLTAFTVRADGDPTRWSKGRCDNHTGWKLKYPKEIMRARRVCKTRVQNRYMFKATQPCHMNK